MKDISPRELFERTLHFWWLLAGLLILGGLVGWGFSRLQRPVYEATAIFEVPVDQEQLVKDGLVTEGQLPLDFAAQDVFVSPAADIFYAADVRAQMIADAQAQSVPLTDQDINSSSFHLDRRDYRWFITVRSTDPARAAALANLWMAEAYPALVSAQAHTAKALELKNQIATIQNCFSGGSFASGNTCAGTQFTDQTDLQAYLAELGQQIVAEREAGRGIDPALSFVMANQAEPPTTPVLYATTTIILAGSALGLLVGLLLLVFLPVAIRDK